MATQRTNDVDRWFWWIFALAWVFYGATVVTVGGSVLEDGPGSLLLPILATAGPQALFSWFVALRRRDLLRPEWGVARTSLVHVGVGLLFAVGSALASSFLLSLLRSAGASPPDAFEYGLVGQAFQGLFLYAIFAGFLMWTESLRRVHESRTAMAREAMLRAQSEAKAIRAQFNPHFVFNTLHSLMLLVRADPATAERAIEDVAELIRYASTLQRREIDLVPLVKELAVARKYLGLEHLRLGERLSVVWDVDEDLDDMVVPAFSVQTLLENSIKHGLEPSARGGTVTVRGRRVGGHLALTVADDGVGPGPVDPAGASGHGLDLLGQRLAALYGTEARLDWWVPTAGGFEATVRVPVRRETDAREAAVTGGAG